MATKTETKVLTISRVFDAPVELVWKTWTEADRFMEWWGPKYFTAPFAKMDVRAGGKYLNAMRSPEGKDFWSTGSYLEVVPKSKLVMTDSFADENGHVVPATDYGLSSDFPLELKLTVTFKEVEGKTRLTLQHEGMPVGAAGKDAEDGWNESLDKLAAYLDVIKTNASLYS